MIHPTQNYIRGAYTVKTCAIDGPDSVTTVGYAGRIVGRNRGPMAMTVPGRTDLATAGRFGVSKLR